MTPLPMTASTALPWSGPASGEAPLQHLAAFQQDALAWLKGWRTHCAPCRQALHTAVLP